LDEKDDEVIFGDPEQFGKVLVMLQMLDYSTDVESFNKCVQRLAVPLN